MSNVEITVIISTTGRRICLRDSLQSIQKSLSIINGRSEILVIHNARDISKQLLALCNEFHARYLHEPMIGLSIARNRGIIEALGEILAFIDDDIIVTPEWASNLLHALDSADVEAVTGRVLTSPRGNDAGREWHAIYGNLPSEPKIYLESSGIPFLIAGRCGLGGNMAFRKSFLLKFGLFDPLFGLGGPLPGADEVDRFYALLRQGKRILYSPNVQAEHLYSGGRDELHSKIRGYATAQTGFLSKCIIEDTSLIGQACRHALQRAKAVLTRPRLEKQLGTPQAPRNRIVWGSLVGPFAYIWSVILENLWPRRRLILPLANRKSGASSSARVLMVLYNAGLAGGPRISRTLANHFKDRMDLTVIVPGVGETTSWLRSAGIGLGVVPRERLRATLNPIHHLKYLLKFPGLVVSYQRVIWVVLPDLIHVDCLLNLPALFAARLCGVKTLLHLQEIQGGVIGTVLALVTGRLANRIVAVSEAAARPFRRRAYETKVAVVPNGTGFGNSLPRYNPGGRISFVGRLSRDKDPVLFVRAVQRVYELEPKATFMICGLTVPGRSQYESELFEGIGRSQIPKEKLIICKDLEDVEDMLRNASIVVSCSIAEPFGLSVIEAMALGIPVVVPRSGAFPEIITDSRTGLLYSLGNLDELVSCILTLLRDPSLAERIGNNGRILVRNRFTEENMFSAMERQYNETLNS